MTNYRREAVAKVKVKADNVSVSDPAVVAKITKGPEYSFFKIPKTALEPYELDLFKYAEDKAAVNFNKAVQAGYKVHSFNCSGGEFWVLMVR